MRHARAGYVSLSAYRCPNPNSFIIAARDGQLPVLRYWQPIHSRCVTTAARSSAWLFNPTAHDAPAAVSARLPSGETWMDVTKLDERLGKAKKRNKFKKKKYKILKIKKKLKK